MLEKREGRTQEALAAFERALKIDPDMAPAYYGIACLHALSQEKGLALAFLEKALRKGFRELAHIEKDPDWNGLRTNPKFIRLLGKYRDKEKGGKKQRDSLIRSILMLWQWDWPSAACTW